jgi:hypothetical protein
MPTELGNPSRNRTHRRLYWAGVAAVTTGLLVAGLVTAGFGRSIRSVVPRSTASQRTGHAQRRVPDLATATSARPSGTNAIVAAPAGANRTHVSKITGSGSLLIIRALGVRAPIIPTGAVGAPETAALTIPADIDTLGWWDGNVTDGDQTIREDAPAPGQPGVAVIAGHVDSAAGGPGALYHLADLKVGDVIDISDSIGQLSTWTVDAPPQTALKTELPPALWVTTGPPKLALVTCGGPFDPATGHYQDNVILWAAQTT